MDASLKQITDFSIQLSYDDLPLRAIHDCKRHLIDTLACALGGFNAEPSKIARVIARRVTSETPARILGTLEQSSPELAAFANGVMMRYLDFNDSQGKGAGHPGDVFAALLAAAESTRTDGKSFITAAVAAYELFLAFGSAMYLRKKGWDSVVYTVLSAAAGAAKIMKLDHEKMANALSLALVPNMALGVVRRGQLSMWKTCAAGNAVRNAIFATQVAAEGMTGPQSVFEGENGVWNALGKFDWPLFAGQERSFRIGDTLIKKYLCIASGQSPVEATLAVQSQINPEDIEAIVVRTYWLGWFGGGREPAQWAPTTRETAEHSIPFLVCAALLDRRIDVATYTPERISDPRLRFLIQRSHVIHHHELDKLQ